jgi:hypothetical protein
MGLQSVDRQAAEAYFWQLDFLIYLAFGNCS